MAAVDTITIPRWVAGLAGTIIAAMLLGGGTQGVLLYSQGQVANERMASITTQLEKVESKLEALQASTASRWTRADHVAYANRLEKKLDRLEADIRSLRKP